MGSIPLPSMESSVVLAADRSVSQKVAASPRPEFAGTKVESDQCESLVGWKPLHVVNRV